ncbi:MAG: 50S ribosomal protein L25, partial [Actinomycetota bacterium]
RKARAAGKVPAVLYGPEVDPKRVAVDARELWHALHTDAGTNVLINLQVDGDTFLTMPREIQRDIVRGTLLHVDFLRIRRDVAIQVEVPIQLIGESHGVKEGGVVEHHLWEVRVEVLPTDVPESVEADISALGIGDSLHVSDVKIPGNVTVITGEDETVVTVVPPPVLVVEPTAEELEAAEAAALEAAEAPEGEEGEAAPAEGEGEGGEKPAEGGGEESS